MARISIDNVIQKKFPALQVGVVWGTIGSPFQNFSEVLSEMQSEAKERLMSLGLQTEELSSHPNVSAWRWAYQQFGVKAKRHRPTHEALVRRILRDEGWPSINPLVDVYLTNQGFHLLPHGGYDLAAISGTILLTICEEKLPFVALGGDKEETEVGEVIYRDNCRVLTRRWNYKDSDETKITPTTRSFALFIESPSNEISKDHLIAATADLQQRVQRAFPSELQTGLLSVDSPELVIF